MSVYALLSVLLSMCHSHAHLCVCDPHGRVVGIDLYVHRHAHVDEHLPTRPVGTYLASQAIRRGGMGNMLTRPVAEMETSQWVGPHHAYISIYKHVHPLSVRVSKGRVLW